MSHTRPMSHFLEASPRASLKRNHTPSKISTAMDREARLRSAMEAYKNGEHKTIRGAATAHDVNRSTLTRRINGAQSIPKALEPRQALSSGEEEGLISWLQ